MGQAMHAATAAPFDLVLGRRTHEIFAAHWPHSDDAPMADRLNGAAKHVASCTLTRLAGPNSHLIGGRRRVPGWDEGYSAASSSPRR